MPRPPTSGSGSSKKNQILSQFPGLHKSVSTPSIVVDHPHHHKGGRSAKNA
jgi:hypothetical protein